MDDSVEVAQNINVFLEAPPVSASNAITKNQENTNQQEVPQNQEIQDNPKEDNQQEDNQSSNQATVNQEINNEPNVQKDCVIDVNNNSRVNPKVVQKKSKLKEKQKKDVKHPPDEDNISNQNSRPNMQSNFNKNADKEPQLNQNKRQNDNRYIQTEEQVLIFEQNKNNNQVNIENNNNGNIIINNVEFQQAIINHGIMQVNNGDNNVMNNTIQTNSTIQPEKKDTHPVTYDLLLYPFLINAIALAICGAVFAYFAFVKVDKILKYFDKDLDSKLSVIGFLILLVTCLALKYSENCVMEGCVTFGSSVFYLLQLGGLVTMFLGYCFFKGDTEEDYKDNMKDPQHYFYYICIGTFGSAIADFSLFLYLAIAKEKYKRALIFVIPILLTIIIYIIFGLATSNWIPYFVAEFYVICISIYNGCFPTLIARRGSEFYKDPMFIALRSFFFVTYVFVWIIIILILIMIMLIIWICRCICESMNSYTYIEIRRGFFRDEIYIY